MGKKKPKRKKVTVKLLQRKHAGKVTEPYRVMEQLVTEHHSHLKDVKIAIAWRFGWNANADGLMTMGRAKKCTDLDKQLAEYDFVILLNHEAWNKGGLNEKQRLALVDHELCHCEVVTDSNGDPKYDEEGRRVCRIRKHDIEEFQDVVARHGLYSHDLAEFAKKSIKDSDRPLLTAAESQPADDKSATKKQEKKPAEKKSSGRRKPNEWKSLDIETFDVYNIPASVIEKLRDADISTLGGLSNRTGEDIQWYKKIKGIGQAASDKIDEAFVAFFADHPEFCDEWACPDAR